MRPGLIHLSDAAHRNMNRWMYCHHHRGMVTCTPLGRQHATRLVVFLCPICFGEVEIGADALKFRPSRRRPPSKATAINAAKMNPQVMG